MDFIEKQNGSLAPGPQTFLGRVENRPNFLDPDGRGVDFNEFALGVDGDQLGQRRFPGARRAVENHAGQPIGFEHSPQQFPVAEEMLLPGEFLQRPRPHANRQRGDAGEVLLSGFGEEIHYLNDSVSSTWDCISLAIAHYKL